jgi:hypothetical protein
MKVIEVSARKGGVGTSTVAVSLAVALSQAKPKSVLLVDTSPNSDTWAIAGASTPVGPHKSSTTLGEHELLLIKTGGNTLATLEHDDLFSFDFVVIDAGLSPASHYFGETPFRVSVVNNSYLSLRAQAFTGGFYADGIVCVHNDGFVLNEKDVKNVLGGRFVHYFGVDNAVARAIDAGLYATSRTNLFADWTGSFIQFHELVEPSKV